MALNLYFASIFTIYAHRNLKYQSLVYIYMCGVYICAGQVVHETW